MNWQAILALVIVTVVAGILVWQASSPKHRHSCKCGCAHDEPAKDRPENAGR